MEDFGNERYADKEYWNERYKDEENFDWFVKYDAFRDLLKHAVQPRHRILNLGCGNSQLSTSMYHDGFHSIVNVDYSETVIAEMRQRHASLTGMTWVVMDIRDMSELPSESFDVVLEKGTLDSLLVDEKDVWNVSDQAEEMINIILIEISRLLKPGGQFISVTFAQPHFRLPLYALPRYCWSIHTDIIGTHFHYFYYRMVKGKSLSEQDIELRRLYLQRKNHCKNYYVTPDSESEDEDFLLKSMSLCNGDC